ncbi:MAG: hypothetical protein BLM47_11395 [Candidatus Reconcilbacillus cellulovorans]|uniref:Uncharacterized protein n=1 Tax=Candidatus Reconcilbacillus cellulovorans TaxID=1906605 RepID=A0A2A6DXW9_9BACL|nr:MAG: hypothetical protein BLM47_11395 [Candidatus Reconcilbacillus cellulovorans]
MYLKRAENSICGNEQEKSKYQHCKKHTDNFDWIPFFGSTPYGEGENRCSVAMNKEPKKFFY